MPTWGTSEVTGSSELRDPSIQTICDLLDLVPEISRYAHVANFVEKLGMCYAIECFAKVQEDDINLLKGGGVIVNGGYSREKLLEV